MEPIELLALPPQAQSSPPAPRRDIESLSSRTNAGKSAFAVHGMTCASCVATLENYLQKQDGISSVVVSLLAERADITHNGAIITAEQVRKAIEEIGFQAEILSDAAITSAGHSTAVLRVEGMTCASCVSAIESHLKSNSFVEKAVVDLLSEKVTVSFRQPVLVGTVPSPSSGITVRQLIAEIDSLGYQASVYKQDNRAEILQKKKEIQKWRSLFLISAIFAIPTLVLMILMWIPPTKLKLDTMITQGVSYYALITWILTTPVQFGIGLRFYIKSVQALRHFSATMDVLIAVGTSAAYLYSVIAVLIGMFNSDFEPIVFFEISLFLIAFVMMGRFLENLAKGKTSEAITKLLMLQVRNSSHHCCRRLCLS
jgi:Cu+-exporting ATPase